MVRLVVYRRCLQVSGVYVPYHDGTSQAMPLMSTRQWSVCWRLSMLLHAHMYV
jgi:hypothetical protein